MNLRSLVALLAAASLLGACSASGSPATSDAAAGSNPVAQEAAGNSEPGKGAKAGSNVDTSLPGKSTRPTGGDAKDGATGGSGGKAPAAANLLPPSVVTDVKGDQFAVVDDQGTPGESGIGGPAYSDIVRASIEDRGSAYEITLRFAGALPERVGDNENLIAGVGLTGADDRTFAVMLQGTREGWNAVYQKGGSSFEVEDWAIEGSQVVWTIPKSQVDVGESFEWGASLRLLDFGGTGMHRGDKAPEAGPRSYPEQ